MALPTLSGDFNQDLLRMQEQVYNATIQQIHKLDYEAQLAAQSAIYNSTASGISPYDACTSYGFSSELGPVMSNPGLVSGSYSVEIDNEERPSSPIQNYKETDFIDLDSL